MPGITLPDLLLLDWLEAHLPEGHDLGAPPPDLHTTARLDQRRTSAPRGR